MSPLLIPGSSHHSLAKKVAKRLNVPLGEIVIKDFACNEIYVQVKGSVRGREVFVVQTCTANVNRDFMETFLICDALRRHDAHEITVVMPHFGYARQDRVAEKGETISAKLMAELLRASGMDNFITLDLHSYQIQGFFDVPIICLRARPLIAEHFKKKKIKNAVVVATDTGSVKIASKFADDLGLGVVLLHKARPKHHETEVAHMVGEVKGKTAIIFDDLIDTAGTVVNAKEYIVKRGAAKDVYVAATHGVFSGPATERLNKAGFKEIVITDTIPLCKERTPKNLKVLSVDEMLANAIKEFSH